MAFRKATETNEWLMAQLPEDVNVSPDPEQWFPNAARTAPDVMRISQCQWLARNAADVAYSAHILFSLHTQEVFAAHGIPECARRLKRLLNYLFEVVARYVYIWWLPNADRIRIVDDPNVPLSKIINNDYRVQLARALAGIEVLEELLTQDLLPFNDSADPTATPDWAKPFVARPVPCEPMHELLGQLYVWVEVKLNRGRLRTRDSVRNVLREMVTPPRILFGQEDPKDWKSESPVKRRLGLPQCIFATREGPETADKPDTLLLGSSGTAYPDTVDPIFEAARRRRITNTPVSLGLNLGAELSNRVRQSDYEYVKLVATAVGDYVKVMEDLGKATPVGLSRAIVNMYIAKRRRTVRRWVPLDHTDQVAMSHLVAPANRISFLRDASTNLQWFQPVPRCMKCRILHAYDIPIIEGEDRLDVYTSANPPFGCAEDIVHAKLRVLHPLNPVPDIQVPAGEIDFDAADENDIRKLFAMSSNPSLDRHHFDFIRVARCAEGYSTERRDPVGKDAFLQQVLKFLRNVIVPPLPVDPPGDGSSGSGGGGSDSKEEKKDKGP